MMEGYELDPGGLSWTKKDPPLQWSGLWRLPAGLALGVLALLFWASLFYGILFIASLPAVLAGWLLGWNW
jgi:hypothetical protein